MLAASSAASGQHAELEDGNPTAQDQADQPGPEAETEARPEATPEPAALLPTALRALEIAVPRLRQVHPRGLVMNISGSTRVGRYEYVDHVREWVIDIWAPELGRRRQYSVETCLLRGAATSSTIPPGGLAPVMALADEHLPSDVMDSDRAIALADAAGAAEFQRAERAQLRTIDLGGRLDGSLLWRLFISRIGFDGASLDVDVDARTGEIRRYSEERAAPTPTPPPPPTPTPARG